MSSRATKNRTAECPVIDFPNYGGNDKIYRFPGIGLCVTGADSFEEAMSIAHEAAEQMEQDGYVWDPAEGKFVTADEDELTSSDEDIIPIERWFTI